MSSIFAIIMKLVSFNMLRNNLDEEIKMSRTLRNMIILMVCFLMVIPLFYLKAEAANMNTPEEAINWVKSKNGTTVGAGQCVSLVAEYIRQLGGTPPSFHNAIYTIMNQTVCHYPCSIHRIILLWSGTILSPIQFKVVSREWTFFISFLSIIYLISNLIHLTGLLTLFLLRNIIDLKGILYVPNRVLYITERSAAGRSFS